MPKRIKLLIDQTGIDEGVSHLIYRSDTLPIPTETPLIEVNEKEVYKRATTEVGEILVQDMDTPLYFHVSRVFMMIPAPTIYIDGVVVDLLNVTLLPRERKIRIDNEQIEPGTSKAVSMDYSYLVSVVEDDYTVPQIGIKHHGSRVLTGLNPPIFVGYDFNPLSRQYKINIKRDTAVDSAYYQLALREDFSGRISKMTAPQHISVTPNLYDLTYRLQVSRDEKKTWEDIQIFTGTDVTLTNIEDITNYAHISLPIEVNRLSDVKAEVIFQNPWFEWWNNLRHTHLYRIREEDVRGEKTSYAELPRGGVNYKPVQLKIRRKQDNGTPALYEGFDALDMWVITEADIDVAKQTIRFVDDHLVAGNKYSYTFYIDDEEGFRSLPFMETTEY